MRESWLLFCFFFLIGGHTLDEGFIIKHWMPAASFLRALTYPGQDSVKCNPLLCILCVCMCQTNNWIVIFPLLVHFYSWFLTLFCPVRVCAGAWRRNSVSVAEWLLNMLCGKLKTPWLLMWTFNFSQSTLMFDLCTVKSGDDRQSALCQDICHAEI